VAPWIFGSGSSASGSGGRIAVSWVLAPTSRGVQCDSWRSSTDIGGAFSVLAGDLSGAAGGDASIIS